MDPLHLCIALGPLAAYFLTLATINLAKRPFLTTGGRDLIALALAVSGFVVAGPLELFFPDSAAYRFGGMVWVLLISLYALGVVLLVLLSKPRLVIYNVSEDELRETLLSVAQTLDPQFNWVGDNLVLPQLGVQVYIEPFPSLRNVQLIASGPRQNADGWKHLEVALGRALKAVEVPPNPYGVTLLLMAVLMLSGSAFWFLREPQAVTQAFVEMMRW